MAGAHRSSQMSCHGRPWYFAKQCAVDERVQVWTRNLPQAEVSISCETARCRLPPPSASCSIRTVLRAVFLARPQRPHESKALCGLQRIVLGRSNISWLTSCPTFLTAAISLLSSRDCSAECAKDAEQHLHTSFSVPRKLAYL